MKLRRALWAVAVAALSLALLAGPRAPAAWAQAEGPQAGALVHVVQPGETLFSIARRYGLTVEALGHANGIADPRLIYAGQSLLIPGGAPLGGAGGSAPYLVPPGDSLPSIAKRYGSTWQTLVRLNHLLAPTTLRAGLVIQVPLPATSTGGETALLTPLGSPYIVRRGDTLFAIALRHGVSRWALAEASQLDNPALLFAGQELIIPGPGGGLLPAPFVAIDVRPLPALTGQALVVAVRTTQPVALEGQLFERPLRFGEEGGVYYALAGVHVFTEPGLYTMEIAATDAQGQRTAVSTGVAVQANRSFYERIDVPAYRTDLLDPGVIKAENERLAEVSARFTAERGWQSTLERPVAGTISSHFGTRRSYEGGPYTSYHSGTDIRAPGGTPVRAAANGTVVLAEPLAIHGNMVVIDHGWGLLSGYAHLSAIEVQVGQRVAAGEEIGKVGNTGLSTGNHLHWEVWVGGISVDGTQWLTEFYPWPEPTLAAGG